MEQAFRLCLSTVDTLVRKMRRSLVIHFVEAVAPAVTTTIAGVIIRRRLTAVLYIPTTYSEVQSEAVRRVL